MLQGCENLTRWCPNRQQSSLKKRRMQGITTKLTRAGPRQPSIILPLLSTRAAINVCGKKKPSGFLAATLCPFTGSPVRPKIWHHSVASPLNTNTPLAGYMPKGPKNKNNSAQATNCYFSVLCDFPCRGAQHWVCKWDPHGCAQSSSSSLGPSPHPCPACALLADSWLQCPTSQPGSLLLFQPCLLPVTVSALSSTLITYNPIFSISLELLDMLSPCSILWLSWCTQELASDSWSRSFTSYCYLLPASFLQAWCSWHSHAVSKAPPTPQNAQTEVGSNITEFLKFMESSSSILLAEVFLAAFSSGFGLVFKQTHFLRDASTQNRKVHQYTQKRDGYWHISMSSTHLIPQMHPAFYLRNSFFCCIFPPSYLKEWNSIKIFHSLQSKQITNPSNPSN